MYQEDFHLSHYQQFPPKLLTQHCQHSVRETLWNFIGHSVLLGESFHRTELLSVWLWVYIIYKVFETTLDNSVRLEMRQIGPFTYLSCRSDGQMNLADTGNTQKTDKVYNFLQYAKLTCVGDLWTQALRSFSQSPRGNLGSTSLADIIWYIAGRFSEFKGHPRRSTLRIGGNRRLCPFSVCCGSNFGENCR